jgi:hypothetical protein
VTPEIASAVRDLWKDPGILELYARANEYQLIDSAALYVVVSNTHTHTHTRAHILNTTLQHDDSVIN